MIDPKARQKLKESIEGYLDEQITAFEFDEQLQEIETEDESVQEAISNLWLFYDDCKDHKIVARKEDWDFFQRLLLFLNSNLEIADLYENESRTKRNFTQLAAVIALLIQASMLLQGQHWLAITALGALATVPIWIIRRRHLNQLFTDQERLDSQRWQQKFYPFSNVSQMRRFATETSFHKAPYPKHLEDREIRNVREHRLMMLSSHLCLYSMHLILSPAILLFECFPTKDSLLRTKTHQDGGINSVTLRSTS